MGFGTMNPQQAAEFLRVLQTRIYLYSPRGFLHKKTKKSHIDTYNRLLLEIEFISSCLLLVVVVRLSFDHVCVDPPAHIIEEEEHE